LNPTQIIYSFTTGDDNYTPLAPTINLSTPADPYYTNYIHLNGTIEPNRYLRIYAASTLVTQAMIIGDSWNIAIRVPEQYLPGQVTLSAVSVSKRGNQSSTSNILSLTITNNSKEFSLSGITANILIPAASFDRATDIQLQSLPLSNPDPAFFIEHMLSMNPVAISGGGTPVQTGPVYISLNLVSPNLSAIPYTVYYLHSSNTWRADGLTLHSVSSTNIEFSTTHFTIFGLGYKLLSTSAGLAVNDIILAPNPVALENEPLNFVYDIAGPGKINVKIYALTGELLANIDKKVGSGQGKFTWNGDTLQNRTVANGVYIALVTIEDNTGKTYRKRIKLAVLN
jgi:hypothetical protein